MTRWWIRALVVALAGAAAAGAVKTGKRRRALGRGSESDPADEQFADANMEAVATGEGMPEAG